METIELNRMGRRSRFHYYSCQFYIICMIILASLSSPIFAQEEGPVTEMIEELYDVQVQSTTAPSENNLMTSPITGADLASPAAASATSGLDMNPVVNSVKVMDFIVLNEEQHEAEFIVDLVQEVKGLKPEMVSPIKLLKFRSLETLDESVLPDFTKPGQIKIKKRVKITVGCRMHYNFYPWDVHGCPLVFLPGGKGAPTGAWKDLKNEAPMCPGGMNTYEFEVKGYRTQLIPIGGGGGNRTSKSEEATAPPPRPMGPVMFTVVPLIERTSSAQVLSQIYSPIVSLVLLGLFTMSWGSHLYRIGTSLACFLTMFIVTPIIWQEIPRRTDGQTATEHYIAICVGFMFQIVFNNIYNYKFLSMGKKSEEKCSSGDVESGGKPGQSNGINLDENNEEIKAKIEKFNVKPEEMHILKMSKLNQFMYFKGIRVGWYQVPIGFLIFNIIYIAVVMGFTIGLPKGFVKVPEPDSELSKLCL